MKILKKVSFGAFILSLLGLLRNIFFFFCQEETDIFKAFMEDDFSETKWYIIS